MKTLNKEKMSQKIIKNIGLSLKSWGPIFLIMSMAMIITPSQASLTGDEHLVISIPNQSKYLMLLKPYPLDYLMAWAGRVYIVAHPDELQLFHGLDIPFQFKNLAKANNEPSPLSTHSSLNGAYHSYAEVEAELFSLEETYPEICQIHNLGQSVEGRNLYALQITDNPGLAENEPGVLFLGCHHAREWISVEVPLLLAQHLVKNYSLDPDIKNLVNQSEIWIVPLVNPDGLEFSIYYYRYWRKNRRNLGNGLFGVDLNRNYSFQWGLDNVGSSPDPSSAIYRGPAPFSEPETQAIRNFMDSHPTIKALVTYHSFGQVILYPWGYTEEPPPQEELLSSLAWSMSKKIAEVYGNEYDFGQAGLSLYLTNGDTTDWALGVYGIPAFTIELPPIDRLYGGFFNAEEDIQKVFNENLPSALFLINWALEMQTDSYFSPPAVLRLANPFFKEIIKN